MGKKHFCFFQTAETGNRTPNSGVKGSCVTPLSWGPCQSSKVLKFTFYFFKYKISYWRYRVSNPGPFTCKANALPLSYIPSWIIPVHDARRARHSFSAGTDFGPRSLDVKIWRLRTSDSDVYKKKLVSMVIHPYFIVVRVRAHRLRRWPNIKPTLSEHMYSSSVVRPICNS